MTHQVAELLQQHQLAPVRPRRDSAGVKLQPRHSPDGTSASAAVRLSQGLGWQATQCVEQKLPQCRLAAAPLQQPIWLVLEPVPQRITSLDPFASGRQRTQGSGRYQVLGKQAIGTLSFDSQLHKPKEEAPQLIEQVRQN